MVLINTFLSYLLLLIVFCVAGGAAIFLGITMRKNKNAKEEQAAKNDN